MLIYVFVHVCISVWTYMCVPVCIHVFVDVVAKMDDPNPVTLTCGTTDGEPVTWKFDGEDLGFDGPHMNVSEVDTPMLGEYSCWRGGKMLSSTYLLLEAEEGEKFGEMFLFHFSFILLCTANGRNLFK